MFRSNYNTLLNYTITTMLFSVFILSVKSTSELTKKETCSVDIGDVKFDLKKLFSENGYSVVSSDRRFWLNICGAAPQCETGEALGVASCEVDSKTKKVTVLGLLNEMTIKTKFKPIGISYKYLNGSGKKFLTEIEFKCNRHLKFDNITFIEPMGEKGRNHKFIFETNKICVKENMNCQITDIENFQYDLQPLYNKDGYNITSNVSTIFFNICGNLSTNKLFGDCSYAGTQVCQLHKNGKYTNLGVFFQEDHILHKDNYFSLIFTGGSECLGNGHIETQIDFRCSLNERKPILVSSTSCRYTILWETPHACPYYYYVHHNCLINGNPLFDSRDFNSLEFLSGTESKNKNQTLKFNICNSVASDDENLSVYLEKNGTKTIYGYVNSTIISKNGELSMKLYGEKCNSKLNYSTNIYFICDHSKQKKAFETVYDDCQIDIKFHTKLACLIDVQPKNCSYKENDSYYDLNPLISPDKNYEFHDSINSIDYFINIGLPIIHGSHALCEQVSSVCMANLSEPDIRKRFTSLGSYDDAKIEFNEKDGLVMSLNEGSVCDAIFSKYSTQILFICDRNTEQGHPVFSSKTNCNYIFEWRTKYACPVKDQNSRELYSNNSRLTETNIAKENHHSMTESLPQENTSEVIVKADDELKVKKFKTEVVSRLNLENAEKYSVENISGSIGEEKIILKNCSVVDIALGSHINLTKLPHNIKVSSNLGNEYSLNICNNGNNCASPICGGRNLNIPYGSNSISHFTVDSIKSFIELDFLSPKKCRNGYYNSTILLRCSHNERNPTILNETECSVKFEWYNQLTCAILDVKMDKNLHNSVIIAISIIVPIVFIVVIIFVLYIRKKKNYRSLNKEETVVFYKKNACD